MYTNADSLRNKLEELKFRIEQESERPNVICITEYKAKNCKKSIPELSEYGIEGYTLFHNGDQCNSARGVMVYVDIKMTATPVDVGGSFVESLFLNLKINNSERLLLGCMYRSPNSNTENNKKLLELLNNINYASYSNVVIVGDFNMPEINWEAPILMNVQGFSMEFIKTMNDNFLQQLVTKPTRGRAGQKSNILDLIITTEENAIEGITYGAPIGKGDHTVIQFKILSAFTMEVIQNDKPLYDKANFDEIRDYFKGIDCSRTLTTLEDDVEKQWSYLKKVYDEIVTKYVPMRKTRPVTGAENLKHRKALDRRILRTVKRKHRLWQRYMETRDGQKYEKYRKERNKLKSRLRASRRRHVRNIAKQAKSNPKKFWAFINNKAAYKDAIPELSIKNKSDNTVKLTNGPRERADALADYFSSVFTREENTDPGCENNPSTLTCEKPSINEVVTTTKEVFEVLSTLKISKSPGPDGMHPRVLKELAHELSEPLAIIFNTSMRQSKIPDDWKLADVTAIHKKGDKRLPENYRPISLTSIVCKVMEKLVRNKLEVYLKCNKMITDKQFGFVKGRSTVLQLLKVLDDWTEAIENGLQTDIIYTDFQKAFDSVAHGRLINKLASYGIKGNLLLWIKSFLTGRRQRVKVNGIPSAWARVLSGVPQGSVLGPLLFVLFINDIVENLECQCYLYADDMKLYRIINDAENAVSLQKNLERVVDWTEKWLLKLNIAKCKVLRVNDKNISSDKMYTISEKGTDTSLEKVGSERDLGVIIDNQLSFGTHIEDIINKSNKIVGVIKRNFRDLDKKTFVTLYKAMVRSRLEYAQAVWSPHKLKYVDALEAVQRRATKILPSLRKYSYADRLRKLNLPTLTYRRARGDMIETYKMVHGIYDKESCPNLQFSRYGATRGHDLKLFKKDCATTIRLNFFSNRIVNKWNCLSSDVVHATSVNSFKNKLDSYWSAQEIVFNYRADFSAGNRTG